MRAAAIVVAAGSGERLALDRPKALVLLAGKPILAHAVRAIAASKTVGLIVVVHPPGLEKESRAAAEEGAAGTPLRFTPGGLSRQDSVACGLALVGESWEVVLVHDAARPLVPSSCIRALLDIFPEARAASLAVPASDSTVEADSGLVARYLDRDRLWLLQTPQAFDRALLAEAHARAGRDVIAANDDASLALLVGAEVRLVPGSGENRKITGPDDLLFAEAVLARRKKEQP